MGNLNTFLKLNYWQKFETAWAEIFETVVADSSLEEIEKFYQRLSKVPTYTERERFTRTNQRLNIERITLNGDIRTGQGFVIPTPQETVKLLDLDPKFCKKGVKSWIITI